MPPTASPIGAAVRAELARANVSGRQLARDLGWGAGYVTRRTSGAVSFRVDELRQIATYLGIPIGRLLDPEPVADGSPAQQATAHAS